MWDDHFSTAGLLNPPLWHLGLEGFSQERAVLCLVVSPHQWTLYVICRWEPPAPKLWQPNTSRKCQMTSSNVPVWELLLCSQNRWWQGSYLPLSITQSSTRRLDSKEEALHFPGSDKQESITLSRGTAKPWVPWSGETVLLHEPKVWTESPPGPSRASGRSRRAGDKQAVSPENCHQEAPTTPLNCYRMVTPPHLMQAKQGTECSL